MLKQVLLFLSLIVLFSYETTGQSYKFALGVRGGISNGISAKYFIAENKAVEGIFTRRYRGYTITGLYEIQKTTKVENLWWFYGVGAHVATYNSYYYYGFDRRNSYHYRGVTYYGYYSEPVIIVGLDAIIGLEYRFKEIPFTVGIDTKPYFDLIGRGDSFFDTALSVRYIFK